MKFCNYTHIFPPPFWMWWQLQRPCKALGWHKRQVGEQNKPTCPHVACIAAKGWRNAAGPSTRGQPEEFYKDVGESRTFTWNGAIFQGHLQSHRTETHLRDMSAERWKVFTEHGKEGSQPITTSRAKAREINTGPYSPTQADLMQMPMLSTLLTEYRQLV